MLNKRIFELEASLQQERAAHATGGSAHEQEFEGYKKKIALLTAEVSHTHTNSRKSCFSAGN